MGLGVLDLPERPARVQQLGVDVHLLEEGGHEAPLVAVVQDGELRVDPALFPVAPQHPEAEGVEGGDEEPAGPDAGDLHDALPHLPRRLVGEGDGQDLGGMGPFRLDEVGEAVGEGAGLAAARPGEDHQGAFGARDGLPLPVVEGV